MLIYRDFDQWIGHWTRRPLIFFPNAEIFLIKPLFHLILTTSRDLDSPDILFHF